jgi:hypothetical protein
MNQKALAFSTLLSSQETDTTLEDPTRTLSGATHLTYHPPTRSQAPISRSRLDTRRRWPPGSHHLGRRPTAITSTRTPRPDRPPLSGVLHPSYWGRPTPYRADPLLRTNLCSAGSPRCGPSSGVPLPLGRREHYVRPGRGSNRSPGVAVSGLARALLPRHVVSRSCWREGGDRDLGRRGEGLQHHAVALGQPDQRGQLVG